MTSPVQPNRPVRTQDEFEVECLCGKFLCSPDREMTCTGCGRTLVVVWPALLGSKVEEGKKGK